MIVGVLALQGAFLEHSNMLAHLNVTSREIRLPGDLAGIDALIIPGGESTTISHLMSEYGLSTPIKQLAGEGLPIFGTCAGLILLSKKIMDSPIKSLELLDIEARRNAFGRQIDSFETDLSSPALGKETFRGIFIRAPLIEKSSPEVEVVCRLNGGRPVAVKQKNIFACSFHPELTEDTRMHALFLRMVAGN